MITVTFTPFDLQSKEYLNLRRLLVEHSPAPDRGSISLPFGTYETNMLNDKGGNGGKQVLRELNYNPKRAVIVDARDPDLISDTLTTLNKLTGTEGFRAADISGRFFIVTRNFACDIVNGLLSGYDEHLRNLVEKPYNNQIRYF
jgi:hypothetical protein